MKTGTFLCWLFGHKFIQWTQRTMFDTETRTRVTTHTLVVVFFCIRCGADRKVVEKQV